MANHLTGTANPLEANSEMAPHMTHARDNYDIDNDNDNDKGNFVDCEFEGDEGKAATHLSPCVRASHAIFCSGQVYASHASFCSGFDFALGPPSGCDGDAMVTSKCCFGIGSCCRLVDRIFRNNIHMRSARYSRSDSQNGLWFVCGVCVCVCVYRQQLGKAFL